MSRVENAVSEPEAAASTESPENAARWMRRLWIVVGVFVAIGVARSVQVGIMWVDPRGAWGLLRLAYTIVLFGIFVLLDGWLRTARPRTWAGVRATVQLKWTRRRLALAWGALAAYHVTYMAYHNLKSWVVFLPSQDEKLLEWDRWLFGGRSIHELMHSFFGTNDFSAYLIRDWYEIFGTFVILAFPAAVVFAARIRDALVCITAFCWVWILGTACYYLIPSQGPFWSAPEEFTALPHMSIQDTQAKYAQQRLDMLANPHGDGLYAQISAFASLHVGVTAVILGVAWWYGMKKTTIFMSIFLAGTMVATVYLGWHFFVDVPAGLFIAWLSWWLAPRTLGVRGRPKTLELDAGVPERL